MMGSIGFENHRISCIIGMLPEEREELQYILVEMRAEVDFSKCAMTDNIDDTVDYVKLAKICTDLAQKNKYKLLETYAAAVLETVFAQHPVHSAWIKVKKPKGLPSADWSVVELARRKIWLGH